MRERRTVCVVGEREGMRICSERETVCVVTERLSESVVRERVYIL